MKILCVGCFVSVGLIVMLIAMLIAI